MFLKTGGIPQGFTTTGINILSFRSARENKEKEIIVSIKVKKSIMYILVVSELVFRN